MKNESEFIRKSDLWGVLLWGHVFMVEAHPRVWRGISLISD